MAMNLATQICGLPLSLRSWTSSRVKRLLPKTLMRLLWRLISWTIFSKRLAGLPPTENGKHDNGPAISLERHDANNCQHKRDLEAIVERIIELEQKLENVEVEKAGLEVALAENQEQCTISQDQLREAEEKLVELHRQLDYSNDLKQKTEAEMEVTVLRREAMESQLITMDGEVQELRAKAVSLEIELEDERAVSVEMRVKMVSLEIQLEDERALSAKMTAKSRKLEDELYRKRKEAELRQDATSNGESKIKQEKELAVAAGKLVECQKTIASLGKQLKSLATFEDFLIDSGNPLELNGGSVYSRNEESLSRRDFVPRTNTEPIKIPRVPLAVNGTNVESPPSSSSSSSLGNHSVTSEKSRNGFGKLFSRSKSAMRLENQ